MWVPFWKEAEMKLIINPSTPNDLHMGRTAPLTSKHCILYIYSTNVGTEYFKHALYCPYFFSSKCSLFHNANLSGFCIIHILHTGCAEIKKKIRRQSVKIFVLLTLGMYADDNTNPLSPLEPSAADKGSLIISSANLQ